MGIITSRVINLSLHMFDKSSLVSFGLFSSHGQSDALIRNHFFFFSLWRQLIFWASYKLVKARKENPLNWDDDKFLTRRWFSSYWRRSSNWLNLSIHYHRLAEWKSKWRRRHFSLTKVKRGLTNETKIREKCTNHSKEKKLFFLSLW